MPNIAQHARRVGLVVNRVEGADQVVAGRLVELRGVDRQKPGVGQPKLPRLRLCGANRLADDQAADIAAAALHQLSRLGLPAELAPRHDPSAASREPLVEPLTKREHTILGLLAAGCSNQEIAERLTFSIGTIKWYTSQIYGKLGVGSRTQALARARELGPLE